MGGVVYGIVEFFSLLEQRYVSEHGLPQRINIVPHEKFTNCDVSWVFGSKSGRGVVACGMVWTFVQIHHPCRW